MERFKCQGFSSNTLQMKNRQTCSRSYFSLNSHLRTKKTTINNDEKWYYFMFIWTWSPAAGETRADTGRTCTTRTTLRLQRACSGFKPTTLLLRSDIDNNCTFAHVQSTFDRGEKGCMLKMKTCIKSRWRQSLYSFWQASFTQTKNSHCAASDHNMLPLLQKSQILKIKKILHHLRAN